MDPIILDIINSYKLSYSAKNYKYKDFIAYVYKSFDDKINLCKVEKLKNKYKHMRVNALKYIVANEKIITSEICKK